MKEKGATRKRANQSRKNERERDLSTRDDKRNTYSRWDRDCPALMDEQGVMYIVE